MYLAIIIKDLHFLNRGDFKLLNERVHPDKRPIPKLAVLYRRPVNQYGSDSSMNNTVHDINLMLLVFLDLKKYGIFHS